MRKKHYREPVVSRYMETAEEVQGCGMEPGAGHSTGAKSV